MTSPTNLLSPPAQVTATPEVVRNHMADKNANGSFAAILASIRPKTDIELAEEMRSLIEAVKDTGKPGSLIVRFDVKLVNPGGSEVIFSDKITAKRPERNREGSIAYTDDLNNLSRRDPSMSPLFEDDIRDAPAFDPITGEIKDVPNS